MNFYIFINNQAVGPMTEQQMMAYDVNPNTQVCREGDTAWQPLFNFPELMQLYNQKMATQAPGCGQQQYGYQQQPVADSKRVICGIMALLFGTLGVQYFIMGKVGGGFLTILLSIVTCGCWGILTFIQGIMMLCMTDQEFERKYINSTSTLPLF